MLGTATSIQSAKSELRLDRWMREPPPLGCGGGFRVGLASVALPIALATAATRLGLRLGFRAGCLVVDEVGVWSSDRVQWGPPREEVLGFRTFREHDGAGVSGDGIDCIPEAGWLRFVAAPLEGGNVSLLGYPP